MLRSLTLMTVCALLTVCQGGAKSKPAAPQSNADWVALSGGCFDMGETRIYTEEGPIIEVCLEPFEMWSHEISNSEFAKFVKATGHKNRAELGWKADDDSGPGVDMAPSSAVFVPLKNPKTLNWWALIDGANWQKPLGPK